MAQNFIFQDTKQFTFQDKEEEEENKKKEKFIFDDSIKEVTIFGNTFDTKSGEYIPEKEKTFTFKEPKKEKTFTFKEPEKEKGIIDVSENPYANYDERWFKDFKEIVVGGARDITQSTIDWTNFLLPGDPLKLITSGNKYALPDVDEPDSLAGSFIRDALGFAVPYAGVTKIGTLGKLPDVGKKVTKLFGDKKGWLVKSAVKGAVAEPFAFSPYQERISSIIEQYPSLQNPISGYLKADSKDTEAEAYAKMAMEGAIFALPFDWLFYSLGKPKVRKQTEFKVDNPTLLNKNLKEQNRILKKEADEVEKIIGKKPRSLEGEIIPQPLSQPLVKPQLRKKIEGFALELFEKGKVTRNKFLDLNEQIADLLITNRIGDDEFKVLLKKHKISVNDFARMYSKSTSEAARMLQNLSRISLRLKRALKTANPADVENFKSIQKNEGLDDDVLFDNIFKRLDNVRRAAMVGQLATASRNLFSQIGRVGMNVLEESIDLSIGSAARALTGRSSLAKKPANPLQALKGFLNIFRQLDPDYFTRVKREVDDILKFYPVEADRFFLRYSSDVVNRGGKKFDLVSPIESAVHLLNIFNRTQEFVTRRAVFQSTLDAIIRNNESYYKGKTLNELVNNPTLIQTIRKKDIAVAIDHALEMTYASQPRSKIARSFVGLVNQLPFLATLALPFPRFLVNSLRFQYQFSPLSFIPMVARLMTKPGQTLAKAASGDFSRFSKAVIGTTMLMGAVQLRLQPNATDKWNEWRVGDKTIDILPYNPLAAYLFVGDIIARMYKGTFRGLNLKDISKVFAGTRAGTGVYIIDEFIRMGTGESKAGLKTLTDLLGKVAVQFLTPFRTYTDFYYANDPAYNAWKDTKTEYKVYDSLWEEFIENSKSSITANVKSIFDPTELPDATSATKAIQKPDGSWVASPIIKEFPRGRQLTGLTPIAEKNAAEKEIDRLGIKYFEIFRSTGIPFLDRMYKNLLAPAIHVELSKIVQSDAYLNLPPSAQVVAIKEYIKDIKKEITETLSADPSLVPYLMEYDLRNLPKDEKRLIEDVLGKEYLNTLIKHFQSQQ